MEEGMPPLPSFLDRKLWGPAQWEASAKRQQEAQAFIKAELDALQAKACALKEAKKAKAVEDAQKASLRAEVEARREAKRVLKRAALAYVRRALDKGPVTANGLRQNATEGTSALVPGALRTMLKLGEIEKVSRQTYRRKK